MVVHSYINPYSNMLGGVYNPLLLQNLTQGYNTAQSSMPGPAAYAYPWQSAAMQVNQLSSAVAQLTSQSQLSSAVAQLTSQSHLSSAVAQLTSQSHLSSAVAQMTSQAHLVSTPQLVSSKLGSSAVCSTAVSSSVSGGPIPATVTSSPGEFTLDSKDSSNYPSSPCESNSSMIEEINIQYLKELQAEKETMESNTESKSHAIKLLENEIACIQSGGNKNTGFREPVKYFDIYRERPIRLTVRALIPVREHPKFNFVGKLLGPKGNSMKRLQEDTMTKMAVLGRGSMRDKQKEEDLRLSADPKYQHLQEDLHVEITAFAPPAEAHARIAYALTEVRKYLIPDSNDEIRQEQMREMEIISTNGEVIENLNQTSALLGLRTQGLPFQSSHQGGLGPVITGLPVGSTNGYMTPYMVSGTGLAMDSTPITTQQDQFSNSTLKSSSSLETSKLRVQPYTKP
ncbi:KH domain-containing, RNA-binding, signal transduction-associated protein 3 [Eurytemora carolleeae]|uniref:KH domain-containing, RNA-binding, signal transduction-associated protein 3 n=1 Tax=Eurytemora carolleeae TaxID=1294199 RepID=UPI000C76A7A8|nr:KH domain-containing, RNA-binding, signal transduction-associated protein 3 [Eurytemora carolleeae]|eukprot:XP_023326744.1 KH domain-containing, RNA-binding, signal transduction-associated protein 3-like [Eurytemora affinis]